MQEVNDMSEVTLTDLAGFLALADAAVAERASLTDVAGELGVSQPTLSRRIRRVEEYVGAELFDRDGRRIALNARGQAFLDHARRAGHEIERGTALVRRLMDPERGTVRLDFMHSLGTWLVPRLLRSYRLAHPGVEIALHQGAARHLVDRVLSGAADVALVGPAPAPELRDRLRWHPLRAQRLALALPQEHRLAVGAAGSPLALAEVAGEPFIGMLPGYGTRILLDRLAAQAGFRPRFVFESMELTTVTGLVSAGLGVALLPMDDPYLAPTGLVLRPLDPPAYRELGVVWRRETRPAPPVDQFRRFVVGTAGDDAPAAG
ncbi:LysR family transcriptional regulator [Corynebacterium frankenforstense]|nr:LysR family transcriptional regulator [Corynebacterium frankenforstense]